MFRNFRHLRVEAGENQTTVNSHLGTHQAEFAAVEFPAIAASVWQAHQFTTIGISPTVIPATKVARIATLFLANSGTAMHTPIHQHMHATVLVAGHDRGLRANRDSLIVASGADFAVVTHENPGALEDPFHFSFEDFGFGINFSMDTLVSNEFVKIQL